MEHILFYGHRSGEHKCFSNFYPIDFKFDGNNFNCSEQAYMYYKSFDKVYRDKILKLSNPFEIKKLGRECELVKGWDDKKVEIMYNVVYAKFSQNDHIKDILLSTGTASIHEDCKDPWWGGGPNYPAGRDLLGKVLMRIRNKLNNE